jgi:hypothetical protein
MATESGSGRSKEPSWHRRARRIRSGQRLLAQVTAACVGMAEHHGSCPPAILRPLLDVLVPRAPMPRDVPWPSLLTSSSSGSPRVVIPMEELAVRGDLSSFPSGIPTSLSTSHTVVPVSSVGDFRSLPGDYWRTISTRTSWKYHSISSTSSLPSLVLDDDLRALALLRILAVVTPLAASVRESWSSSSMSDHMNEQVNASPDIQLRIASIFQALDDIVESIPAEAPSWTFLSDVNKYLERFKVRLFSFHCPH